MSTSSRGDVAVANDHRKTPFTSYDDFVACCDELLAGMDEREQRLADIRRESGIDEAGDHLDKLQSVVGKALTDIESCSVTTLSGLIVKCKFLIEEEVYHLPPEQMLVDLKRIAGEA